MIIKLSPTMSDSELIVVRIGDVLTLNGADLDFSPLPEGALLPAAAIDNEWVEGPVTRTDGHIVITLRAPYKTGASEAACFPEPIVNPPNGLVRLPV